MKKLFFYKRIPEPKTMEAEEMKVFELLAKDANNRWIPPILFDIAAFVKKDTSKILDLACGPGLLCQGIATKYSSVEVTGVDISKTAINMAKVNCRGLKNIKFIVSNAYKLPFKDNTFDLVVCKDSVHHFNDPKKLFREILRVIKPGSTVYIQDLKRNLPSYLIDRATPPDNPIKKLQYYSARAAYTREEIKSFIKSLKVKKYEIRTHKVSKKILKHLHLKNPEEIKRLKESFQARFMAVFKKNEFILPK